MFKEDKQNSGNPHGPVGRNEAGGPLAEGFDPPSPPASVFTEADRELIVSCQQMLIQLFEILKLENQARKLEGNPPFIDEAQYRQALSAFLHGDRRPLEGYKKRGGMIPRKVRLVK